MMIGYLVSELTTDRAKMPQTVMTLRSEHMLIFLFFNSEKMWLTTLILCSRTWVKNCCVSETEGRDWIWFAFPTSEFGWQQIFIFTKVLNWGLNVWPHTTPTFLSTLCYSSMFTLHWMALVRCWWLMTKRKRFYPRTVVTLDSCSPYILGPLLTHSPSLCVFWLAALHECCPGHWKASSMESASFCLITFACSVRCWLVFNRSVDDGEASSPWSLIMRLGVFSRFYCPVFDPNTDLTFGQLRAEAIQSCLGG